MHSEYFLQNKELVEKVKLSQIAILYSNCCFVYFASRTIWVAKIHASWIFHVISMIQSYKRQNVSIWFYCKEIQIKSRKKIPTVYVIPIQNPLMMTHKANHQSKTQFIDNWKVTSIPRRNMLAPLLLNAVLKGSILKVHCWYLKATHREGKTLYSAFAF